MIPILIGVTLLIFAIIQFFSPMQRVALYVDNPKEIGSFSALIEKYGLNDPIYLQYFRWIGGVLQGNLGYSKSINAPVTGIIIQRAPATAEITIFSAPIIIFLGIWMGIQSAVHRDKMFDHVSRVFSIVGWSLPTFWFGLILISIFHVGLGWFPSGRLGDEANIFIMTTGFIRYTGLNTVDGLLNGQAWITLDALRHLVLPVTTLTVVIIALIVRIMRSSMLEALNKGYIVAARAKGLSQNEVTNKHARRNALIPVITVSGMLTAGMLTGLVITEYIFNIPGIGMWAANAAIAIDIPGVLGFAIFSALIFVTANLIVDVLYAYIDPRIRLG
jgi:peptide/nickel transport system permease protein